MEKTNSDLVLEFKKHVTHASGKVISKRFGAAYLSREIPEIYNELLLRTSFLDDSYTIRERVFFLEHDISEEKFCVVCGSPVHPKSSGGWDNTKLTDVCSSKCWAKHPNKSSILTDAFKSRDENAAKIKRADTMLAKYGVAYNMQRDELKDALRNRPSTTNPYAFERLRDKDWVELEYVTNQRTLTDIGAELNCYYGTVGDWVVKHGFTIRSGNGSVSFVERVCRDMVARHIDDGDTLVFNDRSVLPDKREIDILIPSKKLAIEVDGVFWHSYSSNESTDERLRHINKTLSARDSGYDMLHFWCSEIESAPAIVESIIRSKLGKTERIYARKCKISMVSTAIARKFCEDNHLSGFSSAKYYVGLEHEGNLVHLTTFGTPRDRRNNYTWELIRSCSLLNTTVVGGLGKCLTHFTKTYCSSGDTIMSYADRRYSNGNSYQKVGFSVVADDQTDVGYWWVTQNGVEHRSKYQKKKLAKILPDYNPSESESKNMFRHGFRRLWDCGNIKLAYTVE